jgi:hypothetical protein
MSFKSNQQKYKKYKMQKSLSIYTKLCTTVDLYLPAALPREHQESNLKN